MNGLRDQYVALRRALGTKLQEPARTLERFLDFLEREGSEFITSELALRWAMEPQGVQRATWARRLGMVRRFAAWFSTIDARTEVPPHRLLAPRPKRNKPHIFTEQEVGQLMAAATRLGSPTGLRALTYTTLIGLLTATGLRPGEALALDRSDVDLETGILAIRQTKFGKSRFVPVSDSARAALQEYAKQRDALRPSRRTDAFLVSEHGARVQGCTARRTFARISRTIGLRPATESGRIGRGRDFRTSATVSQRANSSSGIEPASTSEGKCQSSLPISDTWISPTPTGTWKRFRNSCNWPPTAWAGTTPEADSERFQPAIPHSAFLHRSTAEATRRKPTYGSRLP